MKYIIFERADLIPVSVIFDVNTDHNEMARKIGLPVLSAGQIRFAEGAFHCVSGSVTLKQSYNQAQSQEDTRILERLNNL